MRSKTQFVAFIKPPFRIEIAVPGTLATTKDEARTIAEKEMSAMNGYTFQGVN